LDFSFDGGSRARLQRPDLTYGGTIVVTQWQDEQQILHLPDAKSLQLFRESAADSA